jgi:hypothetical protein
MVGFDINCLLYQYILLVRDICEKYQLRSKVEDNTKHFKTSAELTNAILEKWRRFQQERFCSLVLGMNRDVSALAFNAVQRVHCRRTQRH